MSSETVVVSSAVDGHVPLVARTQLYPYSGMPSSSLDGSPEASIVPSITRSTQSSGATAPGSVLAFEKS